VKALRYFINSLWNTSKLSNKKGIWLETQYHVLDLRIAHRNISSEVLVNRPRCFPSLQRLFYENGGAEIGFEDLLLYKGTSDHWLQ
jgi:hypothetical protein